MRHIREDNEALATCREILRDAESLLTHTTFVFEKVNFLMAAAQGFISIQQNQIIKIFSIAAVVFLPPARGQYLRHELRLHARTAMEGRLSLCPGPYGPGGYGPLPFL